MSVFSWSVKSCKFFFWDIVAFEDELLKWVEKFATAFQAFLPSYYCFNTFYSDIKKNDCKLVVDLFYLCCNGAFCKLLALEAFEGKFLEIEVFLIRIDFLEP